MSWDADELARLRGLLNKKPHVRGLGCNQYGNTMDIKPTDRKRFRQLAEQWETETIFLSNSDRAATHPAHQKIVSMGKHAVPLILERMQSQGGHWFDALYAITHADPIEPADSGNIQAMQASWLEWGKRNGYV